MNDRDELAALLRATIADKADTWVPEEDSIDDQKIDGWVDFNELADVILARWRLAPVEAPKHWPSTDLASGSSELVCDLCGQSWPCPTYLIEHHPDYTESEHQPTSTAMYCECDLCGEVWPCQAYRKERNGHAAD